MDEEVSSIAQDAWQELATALRVQVRKLVGDTRAMSPAELKDLVDAAQRLYWLELNAATFDKRVELEMARVFPE